VEPAPGVLTLRELASRYVDYLQQRATTGKPKPITPRTLHDYVKIVRAFGKAVGGDTPAAKVGPPEFAAFARSIGHLAPSAFGAIVGKVRAWWNWAVDAELIDRVRFGPDFRVPPAAELRDSRIARRRRFTPAEVARLYESADATIKPMIGLGICGALNNSEVGWLERECVDLASGVLDFRRRKRGKVRRVVPLPPDVVAALAAYARPDPIDPAHAGLFFVSPAGHPYNRQRDTADGGHTDKVGLDFARHMRRAGLKVAGAGDGRSFAGLRTTFANLAPGGYREEVEIITGHARGTVLLDHYLEDVGLARLVHVVDHVWGQVSQWFSREWHGPVPVPARSRWPG
ncbi:MAG: Phage integrase family protein, partial [Phycisphaerales bacterium]|nr:Phage integrase family protein [Phycisphaerales bacterium]